MKRHFLAQTKSTPSSPVFIVISRVAFVLALFLLYVADLRTNPPAWYLQIDESSIAMNAWTIASSGIDEWGNSFPVYFRAYGEYKNPVYIYALAAVFKIFGPGIFAARLFSAFLGFVTALVLGFLAWRIKKRWSVAIATFAFGLVTPWLFELSRLVLEVTLFPLAVALVLVTLYETSAGDAKTWRHGVTLGMSLGLLTYTYTAGRLMGPLFLLGFPLAWNKRNGKALLAAVGVYVLCLLPAMLFERAHPRALLARYDMVGTVPQNEGILKPIRIVWQNLHDLNVRNVFWCCDRHRHHVSVYVGLLYLAQGALALGGFFVMWRRAPKAWCRWFTWALVASIVPWSLTYGFNALRLAALPVFAVALSIYAFEVVTQLKNRRVRLVFAAALSASVVIQAAIYFHVHRRYGPERDPWFDKCFVDVFHRAMDDGRPRYFEWYTFVNARWYSVLEKRDESKLHAFLSIDSLPAGSLLIAMIEKPSLREIHRCGTTAMYDIYLYEK